MAEQKSNNDSHYGCALIILIIICVVAYFANNTKSTDEIAEQVSTQMPANCVGVGEIDTVEADGDNLVFVQDASRQYLDKDVMSRMDIKKLVDDYIIVFTTHLGILDDVIDSKTNIIFRFRWDDGFVLDYKFGYKEIEERKKKVTKRVEEYKDAIKLLED